jgi:hypothetical protein
MMMGIGTPSSKSRIDRMMDFLSFAEFLQAAAGVYDAILSRCLPPIVAA